MANLSDGIVFEVCAVCGENEYFTAYQVRLEEFAPMVGGQGNPRTTHRMVLCKGCANAVKKVLA
jgi:hypothetical protein